jgi:putative transposase
VVPVPAAGERRERPNQVWSTDITYIRLKEGFVYLAAVMDAFSRYVLSWSLSTAYCCVGRKNR